MSLSLLSAGALPIFVLHVVAGVLALVVAAVVWRRHDSPGGLAATIALLACADWCLCRATGLIINGNDRKLLVGMAMAAGAMTMPFALLVFAVQYARPERPRLWRWVTRLAMVLPLVIWGAFWANPGKFFWSGAYVDQSGDFPIFSVRFGYGFWAELACIDLALLTSIIILARFVIANQGLFRRQAALLVTALAVPSGALGSYAAWQGPFRALQLTAPSLTVLVVLIGWAVFSQHLLDVVPVAQRLVIEGMTDPVIVVNMRRQVIHLNAAAQRLAQVGPGWQGSPLARVLPGLEPLMPAEPDSTAAAELAWGGEPERRHFDVAISPLTDRSGHAHAHVLVLRDATGQRVLAEASAGLIGAMGQAAILDAAFAALGQLLPEHPQERLLLALQADERFVVVTSRSTATDPLLEPGSTVPGLASGGTQLAPHPGNQREGLVMWLQAPAARKMALIVEASGLWTDTRRQLVEALAALVAMRLEVNLEVEARAEDLLRLNRLKDSLLDRVSHELRTPLSAIRAYSEMLLTYDDPNVRHEFLDIINTESERLTRLVSNVLDLTKMESGTFVWNLTTVDVPALLNDTARIYRPLAEEAKLRLEVRCASGLPGVWGDRDHLQQVLANLLHNALKFTLDGEIVVAAERIGGEVHVSVSDSGIGVPEQDRERIFEKFEQVETATAGAAKGTGLGLAICRELLRQQHGRIWVSPRPGGGSIFTFAVPAVSTAHPATALT